MEYKVECKTCGAKMDESEATSHAVECHPDLTDVGFETIGLPEPQRRMILVHPWRNDATAV